ncbi:WhiB family transcriptional regulator [Streptomyces sp. NPDC001552]|uniref:WhiB family transcriptional regulator n=1 Tax=Streptomyces sp. NPDC001552 TaxID=3364587 RepID=UPI0036A549C2
MALAGPYAPDTLGHRDNWRTEAACAPWNAPLFHPKHEGTGPAYAPEAKAICARCPVRAQCLEWALITGDPHGVWGGLDAGERKQLFVPRAPVLVAEGAAPQAPEPQPVQ